jgi:hypothetical protein
MSSGSAARTSRDQSLVSRIDAGRNVLRGNEPLIGIGANALGR